MSWEQFPIIDLRQLSKSVKNIQREKADQNLLLPPVCFKELKDQGSSKSKNKCTKQIQAQFSQGNKDAKLRKPLQGVIAGEKENFLNFSRKTKVKRIKTCSKASQEDEMGNFFIQTCSGLPKRKEFSEFEKELRSEGAQSLQQSKNVQRRKIGEGIKFDYEILNKAPMRFSVNASAVMENVPTNLSINDFQLGKQLGSGKFGEVYACVHKSTNALFALKKIFKSTILEYDMVEQFARQLKICYSLNHPNIVKLYAHFDDEYHVFLLMEYAPSGCAIDGLSFKKGQNFSSKVVFQTTQALSHVHSKRIVHRDIKPQNIVAFFEVNQFVTQDTFKLCDFGLSAFVDRGQMKHTFCGTPEYLSPQMKDIGEYDFSVDIWSLGVLAYELIVGEAPFKDKIGEWKKSGWKKNIYTTWDVRYPVSLSEVAKDFLQKLLRKEPETRASLQACISHQFLLRKPETKFVAFDNQFAQI